MSSIPTETPVWILSNPPVGEIQSDTFKQTVRPIPELQDGQVLVKLDYFSNEPAQRTWMDGDTDPRRLYAPPIKKDDAVRSLGMGTIVKSKSSKWKEGQQVTGLFSWAKYAVINAPNASAEAVKIPGHSELISLGTLGMTGLTAWVGAFEFCKLKKDDVFVVSGAAGAVGSVLVQIAKHVVGCKKVVGIAGGEKKCKWVEKIGADVCVDYKSPTWKEDLVRELPDYADCFFDNVGGEIINEMLALTKRYGKVVVCGAIANYHGKKLELPNWREVVYNRLNVQGYIVSDSYEKFPQGVKELKEWVEAGKITTEESETIVETKFEDIPQTWKMLFTGGNTGKLITKLV